MYSLRAGEGTVVHELSHQWFGDAVSPQRWQDIWLNEGLRKVSHQDLGASFDAWVRTPSKPTV